MVSRVAAINRHWMLDNHWRWLMNVTLDNGWLRGWSEIRLWFWRGLQCGDHVFTDTLVVQRNDVAHRHGANVTTLSNLIDDHVITKTTASHRNDVAQSHGRLLNNKLSLHRCLLLLMVAVSGLLASVSLFAIGSITQDATCHSTDHATNGGTGTSLIAVVANDPTGNCPGQSPHHGAALLLHLRDCS